MKKIILIIIIPLLGLLTVQLCLKNPKTRELFTDIESVEQIKQVSYKQSNCIVVSVKHYDELEIYFNGEKVDEFTSNAYLLEIPCSGVVEIKNNSNRVCEVTVNSYCNNASVKTINSMAGAGITPVCMVILY